jgi:hypothetical protein
MRSDEKVIPIYTKRIAMRSEIIKKAVFNMGGSKMASQELQVSPSTVGKWIRNGVIPNLGKARQVAEASGFELAQLRPTYRCSSL